MSKGSNAKWGQKFVVIPGCTMMSSLDIALDAIKKPLFGGY